MMPTVYRHFDSNGVLLYVGLSVDALVRQRTHSRTSEWWDQVATITLERFDSKEQMVAAEKTAIVNENPRYNVANAINQDGSPRLARNCSKKHYIKTERQIGFEVLLRSMLENGMEAAEIAKGVGVAPATIKNLTKGKIIANASTVDKLAAYFKRQQRKEKA